MIITAFSPRAWRRFAMPLLAACALATPAFAAPNTDPIYTPAMVQTRIEPVTPCADSAVYLVVHLSDPCLRIVSFSPLAIPSQLRVRRLAAYGDSCTSVVPPDARYSLGRFAAGSFTYSLRVRTDVPSDTGTVVTWQDRTLTFTVAPSCSALQPIPYLQLVQLGDSTLFPGRNVRTVCANTPVALTLAGTFPNGCYRYLGSRVTTDASAPTHVTVEMSVRVSCAALATCPAELVPFMDSVRIPALPAGMGLLDIRVIEQCADSSVVGVRRDTFAFRASDCGPPLPPVTTLPHYIQVKVGNPIPSSDSLEVCPGVPTRVMIEGLLTNSCERYMGYRYMPEAAAPNHDFLLIDMGVPCSDSVRACLAVVTAFRDSFFIPPHSPGDRKLDVAVIRFYSCPDSVPRAAGGQLIHYTVADSCAPPPSAPLPHGVMVQIGRASPCMECPPTACPETPVLVKLRATPEHSCVRYLGMRLLPLAGMPDRDVIQVSFRTVCPDSAMPCFMYAPAVTDSLWLPPQAPGEHRLEVRVMDIACADLVLGEASKLLTYTVLDSCEGPPPPPPTERCVFPFLEPAMRITANADICDLRIPRGGIGSVLFSARSQNVRLAGLQGTVRAPQDRLRIDHLEAAGVAAGMHLQTQRESDGSVKFVLWAEHGSPIPADQAMPVLRVFVRADSLAAPGIAYVGAGVSAGSDSTGASIPPCEIYTFAPVAAAVCIGMPATGCNVNGDTLTNVADLVRMVRCWYHPAECPDTLSARPDCNGDGAFHLDDVLCCARTILGGHRDSVGHKPANLRFAFGAPRLVDDILSVPLTMTGGAELGGALLRVSFPADRYEAGNWDAGGYPAAPNGVIGEGSWTLLTEPGAEDILVGLVRLDDGASEDATLWLQLRLRPGQQHGGAVGIAASDLSAPDGGVLDLDLSGVTAQLPSNPAAGITAIELASARPNPASGRTTFAVSLPKAGDVDLAMYDLAGRRVATLWRGALGAGSREFAWEPGNARSGVYFARLVVDGEVRTTRVVLRQAR